jgi:D-alanine-D-alanine ligase
MQTSRAAAAEPPNTSGLGTSATAQGTGRKAHLFELPVAVVHNPAPVLADAADQPPSQAADAEVEDTARAVVEALRAVGVPAELVCHDDLDLPRFAQNLRARGFGRVFNLVESVNGDAAGEADFARSLDAEGLPYTGNRPGILSLALQKDRCRRRLEAFGVPVAGGRAVHPGEALPCDLPFPWFIKPARMDGSIGIDAGSVVYDRASAQTRVDWLLAHCGAPCLVEAYLPGPEINIALVPGGPRGSLLGLATTIDFSGYPAHIPPIVTYNCKWVPGTPEYVARSLDARSVLDGATVDAAIAAARAAFSALEGSGYGRIDLRLDAAGQPRIIDVNPNPDVHPEAGLALAAQFAGFDYAPLMARIAAEATCDAGRAWYDELAQATAASLVAPVSALRESHARRTRLLHAPHPRHRSSGLAGFAAAH